MTRKRKTDAAADPDDGAQAEALAAGAFDAALRAAAAATGTPELFRHLTSGGEPPATDDVDLEVR